MSLHDITVRPACIYERLLRDDRRLSLIGSGANQTLNQTRIYTTSCGSRESYRSATVYKPNENVKIEIVLVAF